MFQRIGDVQLPGILMEVDVATQFSEAVLARRTDSTDELFALYGARLAHGTDNDAKGVSTMIPGIAPKMRSSQRGRWRDEMLAISGSHGPLTTSCWLGTGPRRRLKSEDEEPGRRVNAARGLRLELDAQSAGFEITPHQRHHGGRDGMEWDVGQSMRTHDLHPRQPRREMHVGLLFALRPQIHELA
ncbi:hypothetical protein [Variovorax sp. J31P207]|uniref:hypothetical protein n=1 Tax=Variovorax sp. J31P207 TaxID=3053510 RepID=UPI00257686A7|nr:hypothetical protein [Variovorax sp. J31P207]MDM0071502.1 hypothetical protein [Variovorax sp. J31P207]